MEPFKDHDAAFPRYVVEPYILMTSREGDPVYDPFSGSGKVSVIARDHGRIYVGSEVVREFLELCRQNGLRIEGLF